MKRISIRDVPQWSGGGGSVMSNILLAARERPEVFDLSQQASSWLVPLNRVPTAQIRSGNFLYMPQNAWAWHGPANRREWPRRRALRAASSVGVLRSSGLIRIGPMIPEYRRSSMKSFSTLLPNVLDHKFEADLERSYELVPMFPEPAIYSCGSMWSYRGLEQLIDAHRTYENEGGSLHLVLCGPPSSPGYIESLRSRIAPAQAVMLEPRRIDRAQNLANMRHAGLTIFPSFVEASPVSLLEALVAGSPLAIRDIDANSFLLAANNIATTGLTFTDRRSLVQRMFEPGAAPSVRDSELHDASSRLNARRAWVNDFTAVCEEYLERTS